MDRSKRAIKTPKRFDEEAFDTPTKSHHPNRPSTASISTPGAPAEAVVSSPPAKPFKLQPEPTQPKSIIKVKLAPKLKSRQEEPKETPKAAKETIKHKDSTSSITTPTTTTDPVVSSPPAKQSKLQQEPTQPKSIVKVKLAPKLKSRQEEPKETPKVAKESIKHKDPNVPSELKPIERDGPINFRPKIRRARTPPVFADLMPNVVLPFWDARTAAEEHEDDNVKELVHCHCGISEELGLMVQCETCLTWQHAHCLGIEKPEDAPDGYTCKACSDPRYARESMKFAYDQDWLTKGRMKQFSCDKNSTTEKDARILHQINQLIEAVLYIHRILHSLKVKSRILMKSHDDDSDLKLFRVQWSSNYLHRDGTTFIPTINQPSSTPASTISAIGDTPDPGDIAVETVADVLPEIGQLDVSAILDSTYVPTNHQTTMVSNQEATPSDCRANLRLHIQQTEEFVGIELSSIEEQLSSLEKECEILYKNDGKPSDWGASLSTLKNDLFNMRRYLSLKNQQDD